jgi:DNA-nicking Smr family endonuclease
MSRGRRLSDEERTVWEAVTRKIKPLHSVGKIAAVTATPAQARKPVVTRSVAAPSAKSPVSPPTPTLAPLSRKEKQRVARGRVSIDARLDLHGHTQDEAHGALLRFLRRASTSEKRLALVITGKSGVLRREVPRWLALPEFRAMVIAVEPAAIRHGGEGALYVRVRRERR